MNEDIKDYNGISATEGLSIAASASCNGLLGFSDKDLLTLAAKSIDLYLEWDDRPREWQPVKTCRSWNPLEDDGDALRLAVALKLNVKTPNIDSCIVKDCYGRLLWVGTGEDFAKVTRRAIVMAAAQSIQG